MTTQVLSTIASHLQFADLAVCFNGIPYFVTCTSESNLFEAITEKILLPGEIHTYGRYGLIMRAKVEFATRIDENLIRFVGIIDDLPGKQCYPAQTNYGKDTDWMGKNVKVDALAERVFCGRKRKPLYVITNYPYPLH